MNGGRGSGRDDPGRRIIIFPDVYFGPVALKRETAEVLDEDDLEAVRLLVELGVDRNEARLLVALAQSDEATARQLERAADLRQPQVSVAARALRRRGWVGMRKMQGEGRGRPRHVYRLDVPFGEVLDRVAAKKEREAEEARANVERLRGMAAQYEG